MHNMCFTQKMEWGMEKQLSLDKLPIRWFDSIEDGI